MHQVWTIAIDAPSCCQSVSHWAGCVKTAEWIDGVFGVEQVWCPHQGGKGVQCSLCTILSSIVEAFSVGFKAPQYRTN